MSEPLSINEAGVSYPCVVCPTCNTKIYPSSTLRAHRDRHELKRLFLIDQITKLQYYMGRMR
jgi:hypothetical protein